MKIRRSKRVSNLLSSVNLNTSCNSFDKKLDQQRFSLAWVKNLTKTREKPSMKSKGNRYNKEPMINGLRQIESGRRIAEVCLE